MTTTYDWQAEAGTSTFRSWLVPHLLAERPGWQDIAAASENFTKVEFGITINGIAVDADAFIDTLDKVIHSSVEREAAKKVAELESLNELQDTVYEFAQSVKAQAMKIAKEHDLYFNEDDWR